MLILISVPKSHIFGANPLTYPKVDSPHKYEEEEYDGRNLDEINEKRTGECQSAGHSREMKLADDYGPAIGVERIHTVRK